MTVRPSVDSDLVIITIVLDDPRGLERTLDSLKMQESLDFAHIIVDGGSQPETLVLIQAASRDFGSEYLPGPDRGIYDAMNRSVASLDDSQWVLYLNAGDRMIDAGSTTFLNEAIRQTAADWCYSPILIDEPDGSLRGVPSSEPFSVENFAFWKTRIGHQAVVARVRAMRDVGLFRLDMPNCADYDLLLKLGMRSTPEEWERIFTIYEAGGGADQHGYEVTVAQSRCRRELLDLSAPQRAYDLWTLNKRLAKVFLANRVDGLARRGLVPKNWRRVRPTHNRSVGT